MINTTVAIDHVWYPHIIDEIIKHAPRSSLIKLRATNSVFKDASTRCCATNLLSATAVSVPISRSCPLLASVSLVSSASPSSYKFNQEFEHLLERTKHAKVVEVEGPVYVPCDAHIVAPAFPNLETCRIVTPRTATNRTGPDRQSIIKYFPFGCKTIVMFCHERDYHFALDDVLDSEEFLDDCHHPLGVNRSLPDSVTKLVINQNGALLTSNQVPHVLRTSAHLKTCVLVFPEYRLDIQDPQFFYDIHDHSDDIACDIVFAAIARDIPIVVVGVEQIAALLKQKLKVELVDHIHFGETFQEAWDSLITRVSFINRDEYAKQVEDVNLELVEHLDGFRRYCRCCHRHIVCPWCSKW